MTIHRIGKKPKAAPSVADEQRLPDRHRVDEDRHEDRDDRRDDQPGDPAPSSSAHRAGRRASAAAAPRTARRGRATRLLVQDLFEHRLTSTSGRLSAVVGRLECPAADQLVPSADRQPADGGVEHLDGVRQPDPGALPAAGTSGTCIRQPGLAVTSSSAPVAAMFAALRSPSSRGRLGVERCCRSRPSRSRCSASAIS